MKQTKYKKIFFVGDYSSRIDSLIQTINDNGGYVYISYVSLVRQTLQYIKPTKITLNDKKEFVLENIDDTNIKQLFSKYSSSNMLYFILGCEINTIVAKDYQSCNYFYKRLCNFKLKRRENVLEKVKNKIQQAI